jgi:hypothetical protein
MVALCLLDTKSSKRLNHGMTLAEYKYHKQNSGQKGGVIKCRALAQRLSQF